MFDLVFAKEDTVHVTVTTEEPAAEGVSDAPVTETAERPYTPAEGLDPEAPYGYTIDRKTGEKRPRKRAGRGVRVVKVEAPPEQEAKSGREPDRVPGQIKPPEKKTRTRGVREPRPEPEPIPAFRAGPIAKGMNKLYLRAGKILKAMDSDLGVAVISMTKAEYGENGERTEGDLTVGEAWEAVAQVNPRIRRLLLKLIEGGAWGALFWAHAPLLLAIMMKERVARRIPFARLAASFFSDDDDGTQTGDPDAGGLGGLLAGMTQQDLEQAAAAFSAFMPGMTASPGMTTTADFYAANPARNGTMRQATAEDLGFGDAPS